MQPIHSRSAPSNCIFPLQAQLHMDDSQHQQTGKGIVEDFAIGTVQFRDSSQCETQGHVLDEVVEGAGVEEEKVGFVIRSGFCGVDVTVAQKLLGLDPTIENAIGQ